MGNQKERGRKTFKDLNIQKLSELLVNKEKERETPEVTHWIELGFLTQEVLDDVVSIYCQVFNVNPENLTDVPDSAEVMSKITSDMGYYEARLAGLHKPMLEIRRRKIDDSGPNGILIRFRTSHHTRRNDFQEAVDGYLGKDYLHLAQSLSKAMGYKQDRA